MKTCPRCKQTKPLSEFGKKQRERDGLQPWCKPCQRADAMKRYNAAPREQSPDGQVKLCECGCGQPTPLARQTVTKKKQIKGQPLRYINGHNDAGGGFKLIPIEERFWDKVDKNRPDGCWWWTSSKTDAGYGLILKGKRNNYLAHRAAWEIANGPIPDGLYVCHHCDNPSCVRPDHLFLGTHQDNMDDAKAKGRMKRAKVRMKAHYVHYNSLKTHCRRGHPLSGDNLKVHRDGRRECRECGREARRQRDKKARGPHETGHLGGVELN